MYSQQECSGAFLNIGEGGNFMQRKKRTKSKLVKQFMNFLLAIALGISLLQLPQLSKEVKAENVNTNNGKQSQEMAGGYYLDKNRNSGKKVIAANVGLTPEDNLGPYIKYTVDGTEHTISWDEAVEKQYIIVDQFIYGGRDFSIHPGTENNPLKRAAKIEFVSPKEVNGIGSNGFSGCNDLEEIIIPDTIQKISTGALREFENLRRITLPGGIMFGGDRTFASTKMEVTVFNVQSLREFVSAYRTLSRTFKKSSEDTEKKVWTLKLKDDEKISIEKTVTAGGMLKLDNEDDEDEQETVERLKDLSATYQWYQVKEDGSEVIIPNATKADLKLNANDFPSRTDAYTLIRRITWKEDNEEFTNTSTVDQTVTLKVNPKAAETHRHKLKIVKAKEASVDAVGNIEYYTCEKCGRFFADKAGHKEIKKSQVIVALKVKKGEVLKKNGTSYQIADAKKLQVSYISPSKKKSGTVSIPSKVVIGGKTYRVTKIKKNAFKNNKKIKKIIIPSSVVSIENYAFANCKNLKTIEIRTTKLKSKNISSKAFAKISKKVAIKVSKKQLKGYKKLLRKKGLSKMNKFKAF